MYVNLLRKMNQTWSGRRDSNPRPLPWQGKTPSFSKLLIQPLDPFFESHFLSLSPFVKFTVIHSNSIKLKISCHLMPPSRRHFEGYFLKQNPRSGNENGKEDHRKRPHHNETFGGPALQGSRGRSDPNSGSKKGPGPRALETGGLDISFPRWPKTLSPTHIFGPRTLRTADRLRRAKRSPVPIQHGQSRRSQWTQQSSGEFGAEAAVSWREYPSRTAPLQAHGDVSG